MDLLSLLRTLWRHKVLTSLVLAGTLAGLLAVVFLTPDVYRSTASLLFVPPPAPPTEEEIRDDPDLAGVNAVNPYLRLGSPFTIIDLMARRANSEEARAELARDGADYEAAPSLSYSNASPFIDVSSEAPTADASVATTEAVLAWIDSEMKGLQAVEGTDPEYMITARRVDATVTSSLQVSGKLRSLVAVVGLGGVLLFVLLSVATAWEDYRREYKPRRARGSRRGGEQQRAGISFGSVREGDAKPAPRATGDAADVGSSDIGRGLLDDDHRLGVGS